jgi:hypothetical protein
MCSDVTWLEHGGVHVDDYDDMFVALEHSIKAEH